MRNNNQLGELLNRPEFHTSTLEFSKQLDNKITPQEKIHFTDLFKRGKNNNTKKK